MKKFLAVTLLVAVMSNLSSCTMFEKTTAPQVRASTMTVVPTGNGLQKPGIKTNSYPNYSFGLNVPYVCQYSGTADMNVTKNCGQACAVMLGGYFNRGTVSYGEILNEDRWLANRFGDSRYNNLGSYYTGFSGRNELGTLLSSYHGLKYQVNYGSSPQVVVGELMYGRPVIVGVMIKGGQLVSSGGVPHWVIATAWSNGIVVNDPGSSSGQNRWLSVAQFDATWATQGRIYIPVYR